MRHLATPHRDPGRLPGRRALARHRPRSPTWSRVHRDRRELRASDIVLALLGMTLLCALCLIGAVKFLGHALAP